MAFLKKLFTKTPEYPSLQPDHKAAMVLVKQQKQLRELQEVANDSLEVIPGKQRSFVLVGKPPKRFGLCWVEGGKVTNLADVARDKQIPGPRLQKMIENVRDAYKRCPEHEKFVARLGESKIVVTPNDELQAAVATAVRDSVSDAEGSE